MENNLCKVSIVIPVYHVENKLFDRCLASIYQQEMTDLEVVIVFDEPAETYQSILNQYEKKGLRIVVKEQNHCGVASARNRGIGAAKGEWVSFVDADDWLEKDAIRNMILTAKSENAEIVMGEHVMEYGNTSKLHSYKDEKMVFDGSKKHMFETDVLKPQTGAGFVWSKVFLRNFLVDQKIYFNERLSAAEDAEFMFRAACAAKRIAYTNTICYHYWFNSNSAVRRYQNDYADKYILSMEALKRDIESNGNRKDCRETYYSCVLYHLLLIAVNYSFHPDAVLSRKEQMKEFKKLLKKAIFCEALKHVHYKDFSKTRQITLWCIKTHLYFGVRMIAQVRHMQFKKYSKR